MTNIRMSQSAPIRGIANRDGKVSLGSFSELKLKRRTQLYVECYPGVFEKDIERALRSFFPEGEIVRTRDRLKPPSKMESMLAFRSVRRPRLRSPN
jgi:hypothetical protein